MLLAASADQKERLPMGACYWHGGDGGESNSPASYDLNKLVPELLDQLIMLGETARRIKYATNGNGTQCNELENLANELLALR